MKTYEVWAWISVESTSLENALDAAKRLLSCGHIDVKEILRELPTRVVQTDIEQIRLIHDGEKEVR